MTCPRCTRPGRRFRRGICNSCYQRLLRSGAERRPRKRGADVVAEWEWLRAWGLTRAEAATRLGMTRAALDKAIERHQRREVAHLDRAA